MYLNQALLRQPLPRVPARNLEPGDVFLADAAPAQVRSARSNPTTALDDGSGVDTISITASDQRRGTVTFSQPVGATLIILPRSWRSHRSLPEETEASRTEVEQAHREVEGRALSEHCDLMSRNEHAQCPGRVEPYDGFALPCGCNCGCYARRQTPTKH